MKKLLVALLLLVMTATNGLALADFSVADGYPVVKDPVTLKIMASKTTYTVDYDEMDLWVDYEKMTGVNIEWELVDSTSFTEVRNLRLATTTELPDAIYNAGLSTSDLMLYGSGGMLLPLNDYLEYMPNMTAWLDKYPEVKAGLTMPSGEIYSAPCIYDPGFQSLIASYRFMINSKWLDNLGLKAPTTIDELTDVLQAFIDGDANGNGDPNDEIPIGFTNGTGATALRYTMQEMAGAYGLGSLGCSKHFDLLVKEDGTLTYAPVSDRYKALISLVHDWWERGFFEPELLTIATNGMTAKAGQDLYGMVYTISEAGFTTDYSDAWISVLPEGPFGDKGYRNTNSALRQAGAFVITTNCKEPELMASWIDWFYSPEGTIKYFMGEENVTYQIVDGEYAFMDWVTHDPSGRLQGEMVGTFTCYSGGGTPSVWQEAYFSGTQKRADSLRSAAVLEPIISWPDFTYTEDETDRLKELSDMTTYVSKMRSDFITGAASLDNWDEYVNAVRNMGLEDYMKIKSDAYNRFVEASSAK